MGRLERVSLVTEPDSAPQYELRVRDHEKSDDEYEIWQLPALATPQVPSATRIAGLRGRNLDLVRFRLLKRLAHSGVHLNVGSDKRKRSYKLTEDMALILGLLFRSLAPMRNRDKIRSVAEGIDEMGREEAAYWLGMAIHRKNPRRVLMALRILLTPPDRSRNMKQS